ncbi:zinc finger (CCCH-type) family protein [Actinidia rufa]|uniref:Zinc finger (CCCH-type) family protein n=1 Tax=Actinidia rufa TaxID=165716 RepID=A0A7J0DHL0_9ERIC|nr:zinc finger (CCCH-type) family protein [Actinidia rufa]
MELKVSSPKAECLSPSDCVSDSEEKDVSDDDDDDDDDRNHKHRRREIGSESMERDSLEQTCLPGLKNDTLALPHFPEFQTRFINRYLLILALVGVEEGNLVLGANMTLGKGLPNVSDSQSPSWSAFGLIPRIPNGGMDTLHSPGMQRSLRTSLAPSLNIGIPLQRCRDFEERGFCLRGDMCPMEHGVNRIVVEDVQSLSQFNLPVSLPSAHLLGTPSALPSVTALSSTLINSKSSKNGADFYDPDQPLWTNDRPETSKAPLGLNSSKLHEPEFFLEGSPSDHHHTGLFDGFGNECPMTSTATIVESQITSSEEAEAALKAPDAVMGNGFIKLWWANRDNIPVDGMGSGNSVTVTPRGVTAISVPPHLSVGHRGRDNLQSAAPKLGVPNASVPAVPASDRTKPVVINSPRAPPSLQKKQESLELLKEELREKQELLDKKRNDFRRQLDKLGKQVILSFPGLSFLNATSLKGDVSSELAAKRHKPRTVADVAKAATPRSADIGTVVASLVAEAMAEKDKYMENVVHQNPKQNTYMTPLEPSSLKHSIRPLAPAGVAVLKEHFSAYGELSVVELEDVESSDSVGYDLPFIWLAPTNSSNDNSVREKPSSASNIPSDANVQPTREVAPVDPHKVSASGNGEAEILERKESSGECTERNED